MAPVKSRNAATVSVTRYPAAASRLAVSVRTGRRYTAIFSVPTILGRHDDCVQSVVGCGKEITEIGMSSGRSGSDYSKHTGSRETERSLKLQADT